MAAFEEPALALQLSRAERGRQERGEARDNALAQRRRRVDHRRRADDRGRLRRSRLRRALALSWLPVLAAWRSNAAAVRSSTAASAPASASTSALASSPASSCSTGAAATVGGKRGWSAVYQTAKQIREAHTRSRVGAQGARCIELEKINSVSGGGFCFANLHSEFELTADPMQNAKCKYAKQSRGPRGEVHRA